VLGCVWFVCFLIWLVCASTACSNVDGVVHVEVRRTAAMATCPRCGRRSRRVHSRYTRRLIDEPIGHPLLIHLLVRRFVCRNRRCPKRTFAEQAPRLAARYARRTVPLRTTLQEIGLALGGRPGARLSARLHRPVSRMTLLRLVHALPLPQDPSPRVVGVDDWARQRGRTYGTIWSTKSVIDRSICYRTVRQRRSPGG
jgi:transposase